MRQAHSFVRALAVRFCTASPLLHDLSDGRPTVCTGWTIERPHHSCHNGTVTSRAGVSVLFLVLHFPFPVCMSVCNIERSENRCEKKKN